MHPVVIFGACAACAAAFASKEHTYDHPGESCTEAHPGMSHKEWEELSYGVVGGIKYTPIGKRGGFWYQDGLPSIAPLTAQDAAMRKAQDLERRGLSATYRPYMRPSPGNGGQTVSTVAANGARPPRVMPRQYRPYMRPSPGNGGQTVSTTTGDLYGPSITSPRLQSDRPTRIRRGRFSGTLSSAERRALPAKEFGLPQQRKYPITDRGHAIAAKGRALTAMRDGFIDSEQYAKIVRKADRWLKKHGDR